jgi:ABC-type transporter Mla subunit MlaD
MSNEPAERWKLGLFVIVGALLAFALVLWLGATRYGRDAQEAITYFDESVQGLEVGSPVKFRGVTIGTVARITIAPDRRHVEVHSNIYLDTLQKLGLKRSAAVEQGTAPFVPANLRVQLVAAGITGVKFLQSDFFDPVKAPPPALPFPTPWNYVPSTESTLKSLEDIALTTLNRFPVIEEKVERLLADAEKTLEAVRSVAAPMNSATSPLGGLVRHLDDTVATYREAGTRLTTVLAHVDTAVQGAELGKTTGSVRAMADAINASAGALQRTAGALAESARDVSGLTREVGGLTQELQDGVHDARKAADAIRSLASSIERDPSALLRGPNQDGVQP